LFNKVTKESTYDKGMKGEAESNSSAKDVLTVSSYLDALNVHIQGLRAKIVGEISDLQTYPRYLFFSLRDKKGDSILKCFMYNKAYQLSGLKLENGLEVIAHGYPWIYKSRGNMTFQTELLELVGEGALKKAYDELKAKLETEGLFAPQRKRIIPEYPQKIGIVTSRNGAVIDDFLSNIGNFGYQTKLIDSKVEGQIAVKDLLAAVKAFRKENIDVLVIMRGGGSLESFMAFNNEILVREIATFPVPVIAGIGHDRDVCLVALAADAMVSTATAVAELLNRSWNQALSKVLLAESKMVSGYEGVLSETKMEIGNASVTIKEKFGAIFEKFRDAEEYFKTVVGKIDSRLSQLRNEVNRFSTSMIKLFEYKFINHLKNGILSKERELILNDPRRQLKLGYSIAMSGGRITKSIKGLKVGDPLMVKLQDGDVGSTIDSIKNG
jgi:exodeoxyribonuclease VII large subunit